MSATVTYKGATLTTATNQTRVLETEGTYLEDDITITDVTTVPTGTKNISITSNGTTTEDVTNYASASITANVPNSYTAGDEGKVVSSGALVSQTSATYTENDTYDTTTVNSVTVNVQGGGGEDYLAKSLNDTLTSYSSNDVTKLPDRAFTDRTTLQSISLPNATTSRGDRQFRNCTNLSSADLPKMTVIPAYCFENCTSLAYFDFSTIINLDNQASFKNTGLIGVYAPATTGLGTFTQEQFANCKELLYARAPKHNANVRFMTYSGCTKLKLVDYGTVGSFSNGLVFQNCTALETLILRRTDNPSSLGNVNNFNGVTQTVNVYVPQALIASYQTATNWSTLYNDGILSFIALEGSPYEQKDFVYMGVPS